MIYTSYFAKMNRLPENVTPIAICAKTPVWYGRKLQYKKLAPKYDFFMEWKTTHDNEFYTRCFKEQVLNRLDPQQVYKELYELVGDYPPCGRYDICLLCYEKPSDFCHRHLVADWFNANGIPCEEYVYGEYHRKEHRLEKRPVEEFYWDDNMMEHVF